MDYLIELGSILGYSRNNGFTLIEHDLLCQVGSISVREPKSLLVSLGLCATMRMIRIEQVALQFIGNPGLRSGRQSLWGTYHTRSGDDALTHGEAVRVAGGVRKFP